MRHSAWLNAVPESPAQSNVRPSRLSRLEQLRRDKKDADFEPDMPPITGGAHLLGYLWEIGPVMAGGMGAAPITHTELAAWQGNTGIVLAAWEARFLRRLSGEWLTASHEGEKADAAAPWQPGEPVTNLAAVANDMRMALRQMAEL